MISFFNSPEYKNKKRTNEQYVTDLYKTFLGRNPDAAGKANWVNHLNSRRLTRDQVLESFANSAEFSQIMSRYGL